MQEIIKFWHLPRKGNHFLNIWQFSIECHKTKTKLLTLTFTTGCRQAQWTNKNSKQIHVTSAKHMQASHDWYWFYFWLVEILGPITKHSNAAPKQLIANYFWHSQRVPQAAAISPVFNTPLPLLPWNQWMILRVTATVLLRPRWFFNIPIGDMTAIVRWEIPMEKQIKMVPYSL